MSIIKRLVKIFLILVLIPVSFTLFFLGYHSVKNIVASRTIPQARQTAENDIDQRVKSGTEILQDTGIVKDQIAFSKVDVCAIGSSGTMWVNTGSHQRCYIRVVAGYTTTKPKSELQKLLREDIRVAHTFGNSSTVSNTRRCVLYNADFSSRSSGQVTYLPKNFDYDEHSCYVPKTISDHLTRNIVVPAYFRNGNSTSARVYETFSHDTISYEENLIWIEFNERYYTEELGCLPGVFCTSPRFSPIHPPHDQ